MLLTKQEKIDGATEHYFASTPLGWAVAPTRDAAVAKAVKLSGKAGAKWAKEGDMPVLVCKVLAPIEAAYTITNWLPAGVEIVDVTRGTITSAKGAWTPDN